ncbi:MAG TPA: divalent metal cation transporter [Candidatus Nitrosotalea sp.]|nr:divalent metal cation transporter [Candidatus Nitrosotalea sp.]
MKFRDRLAKILGPGLISGAADDDPSGIGTYAQGGAQFGLGLSWLALFQFPLMTAIQEMCARIGMTTGSGIVGVIRKRYSKNAVLPVVGLLLVANTITIGADMGAMSSSVQILIPTVPIIYVTIAFAVFIILTEILLSYGAYAKLLKYTTIALFAYVGAAFAVNTDWNQVALSTFIPHFEMNQQYLLMFIAFFGATISPYAFFWQASEEAEEDILKKKIKEFGTGKPRITRREIRTMRTDSILGMAFSQIIMWFIIIVTANTLHVNNITDIQTADQAAKSLEPLVHNFPYAGKIAAMLFSIGIVGTGLLAIPVLAGSSAYALSEGLGWRQGLGKKFGQARGFYAIIIASTLIGLWINFIHVDPIHALVYASIISGIITVPLLVIILKISNDKEILGNKTNGMLSNMLGSVTIVVMTASIVIMFALSYLQKAVM